MKKAFTLVELLAVIVILAVILVIAVPKITDVISNTKDSALLASAKLIAKEAETKYQTNEMLGTSESITCESVSNISSSDYKYCNISFRDGKAYVNITGTGKFEGTGAYGVTKEEGTITESIELANNNELLGTRVLINKGTSENTEGLMYDDFGNLRYSGSNENVKNYVSFNNEIWRIIGLFDIENPNTGIIEKRIKLIRNDSLGSYSWDASDTTVNGGLGVNEWSQSDLKTILHDYYLNASSNQTCYNGRTSSTNEGGQAIYISKSTSCDFSTTGRHLTNAAQSMIENAVWNLGGNSYSNPSTPPYGLASKTQYTAERGTKVRTYKDSLYNNDTIPRTTTWNGLVGLMYPSDYGYASTNENCRINLRAGVTYTNSASDYTNAECKNNNWLFNSTYQWTISPYSNNASIVFFVNYAGNVDNGSACIGFGVRPSVYLKSNIIITSGTGTSGDPYILSL